MNMLHIALAALSLLFASSQPKHVDLSAFRGASYRSIDRFAQVPDRTRRAIAELVPGAIAENGAAWNATDVVGPDDAPVRRFMIAALSSSRTLVVYEHGGIARHQHLLAFETPSAGKPRLVGNVYIDPPRDLTGLLRQITKAQTAADHF